MRTVAWVSLAVVAGLAIGVLGMRLNLGGFAAPAPSVNFSLVNLPPAPSVVATTRDTPNVLRAVTGMARLETVRFHMERVIDKKKITPKLHGLWNEEEAILLIAASDVTAGVDLQKLRPEDVVVDAEKRAVTLTLPKPEVFSFALDSERTKVHSHETEWTASYDVHLETQTRREAEQSLRDAAMEAGILKRAGEGARKTIEGLLRSLGFKEIQVKLNSDRSTAPAVASAQAAP